MSYRDPQQPQYPSTKLCDATGSDALYTFSTLLVAVSYLLSVLLAKCPYSCLTHRLEGLIGIISRSERPACMSVVYAQIRYVNSLSDCGVHVLHSGPSKIISSALSAAAFSKSHSSIQTSGPCRCSPDFTLLLRDAKVRRTGKCT